MSEEQPFASAAYVADEAYWLSFYAARRAPALSWTRIAANACAFILGGAFLILAVPRLLPPPHHEASIGLAFVGVLGAICVTIRALFVTQLSVRPLQRRRFIRQGMQRLDHAAARFSASGLHFEGGVGSAASTTHVGWDELTEAREGRCALTLMRGPTVIQLYVPDTAWAEPGMKQLVMAKVASVQRAAG